MRNRCEETYTFRKTTRFGNQVFGNLVSEIYMFRKPTRFGNCFESVAIIEFVWFLFRIAKVRLHQILDPSSKAADLGGTGKNNDNIQLGSMPIIRKDQRKSTHTTLNPLTCTFVQTALDRVAPTQRKNSACCRRHKDGPSSKKGNSTGRRVYIMYLRQM